jgi:hypothetical protein
MAGPRGRISFFSGLRDGRGTAAALRADALAGAVDFLSIGTNDLSQYTYAADCQVGELAELLDPWQPATLALIAACGEAGRPRTGAGARRRRARQRAGAGRPTGAIAGEGTGQNAAA